MSRRIEHRRWAAEHRERYRMLGRLSMLVFESDAMDPPSREERPYRPYREFWTRVTQWARADSETREVIEKAAAEELEADQPIFQRNLIDWLHSGPELAITRDGQDLLLIGAVPHPPTLLDTRALPAIERPQYYRDRTRLHHRNFYLIQPVVQVVYKPWGVASYGTFDIRTAPDGTQMAFLIDPVRGEGHLVGGSFWAPRVPQAESTSRPGAHEKFWREKVAAAR